MATPGLVSTGNLRLVQVGLEWARDPWVLGSFPFRVLAEAGLLMVFNLVDSVPSGLAFHRALGTPLPTVNICASSSPFWRAHRWAVGCGGGSRWHSTTRQAGRVDPNQGRHWTNGLLFSPFLEAKVLDLTDGTPCPVLVPMGESARTVRASRQAPMSCAFH